MRKFLLFICLSFLLNHGFAQLGRDTRTYEVRSNIPVYPSGILGELDTIPECKDYCVPPYRSRFAVVRSVQNGQIVIRFLDWSTTSANYKLFNRYTPEVSGKSAFKGSGQKYFLINRNDLDSNCVKVYSTGIKSTAFTIGLVTMPMKLRLGRDFDFQGSFSLGTTAGGKMRISKYNHHFLNFLFSAAISTVSLDSMNTNGKVPGQPLTNIATFSPSFGAVFEFGKAQAGIFYGWDLLSKSMQTKYGWVHNRKPWISIGFGFSIFTIDSQNQKDATQQAD